MAWAWRPPTVYSKGQWIDPPPGLCDDGTFVECCTTIDGMTDCHLTTLGRFTPIGPLLLAQAIPDDQDGTIDRLLDSMESIPGPITALQDIRKRVMENIDLAGDQLGKLKLEPTIDVNVPSFGFIVVGIAAGGAIALLSRRKK